MIGRQIGAYRMESKLGSGGMGSVYLATVVGDGYGLSAGDRVALKIIHPHLHSREGFVERFIREGEIGRQVVHRNVVRTHLTGAADVDGETIHYLVMEHVEGRTLRHVSEDVGTFPEALLREIALQVSAGLAAIHRAGAVHRDLKPENVLISEDQRVRIMDLGVARLVEDTMALTAEGQFAGSLYYAAPEQFRGGATDPVSDLYSLGVLLYELATGENPFMRDTAAEVMRSHLTLVPERLDRRDFDISPFLAEMVALLLAKDPSDRIESAALFAAILEKGEDSEWWAGRQAELSPAVARSPRVHVARDTAVLGREKEVAFLRAAWERAVAGDGNVVFVEGEAGIGKTRLVDEFLAGLASKDAHILYGSYPPSGGLGGLSDAVLGHFGPAAAEETLLPYLEVTPRLVPAFAAMLRHEAPPAGSEPIQGDALHAVFAHLLRGMSGEKPLVWVVDDLQFAGADSRRLVLSLARAVQERRALLLFTARPGVPAEDLSHFSRLGNFQRMELSRLSARQVIELLREAFRSEMLAEKLGGKIAYKSDGVPFFVFELIRGLKEGRLIAEQADGTFTETQIISEIEVPSAVRDLVVSRLRDLTDEDRDLLDVAAVQGHRFEPGLTAEVLGLARVRALQRLAAVERRSGVVRSSEGKYRFDHHQVQEVLYGEVPPELRLEYHGMIADAILSREELAESGPSAASGETAHLLASHYLRSNRPDGATDFLQSALNHLEEGYRNEVAIELATRALDTEGLLAGPTRFEALLMKAGCLGHLGLREQERETLEEMRTLAEEGGDPLWRARAGLELGRHYVFSYQAKPAIEALEASLELSEDLEDASIHGSIHGQLGNAHYTLGDFERARSEYREHLRVAEEAGHKRGIAGANGSLGNISSVLGEREEAEARFERCMELMREIGDRRGEVSSLLNLGTLYTRAQQATEARPRYEEALELALEIGYRRGVAIAHGNLGIMESHDGDLTRAMDRYEQCLHISRETGDAEGEGNALLNLSNIRSALGDLTASVELAEESRKVCENSGVRRMEGYAMARMAGACLDTEDFDAAERWGRDAIALWEEIGYRSGIQGTLLHLSEAQRHTGRLDEAAATLDEALALTESVTSTALPLCYRARLPGGDVGQAMRALTEQEDRMAVDVRMGCRLALHEATGDRHHIEEAHRLLMHQRDCAPREFREMMLENVPVHRRIMEAYSP